MWSTVPVTYELVLPRKCLLTPALLWRSQLTSKDAGTHPTPTLPHESAAYALTHPLLTHSSTPT